MTVPELNHMIRYVPHAGQHEFHESDARFKVLIARARFGKSLAAARDMLPDVLAGSTRGWLAGPLYPLSRPEFRTLRSDLRASLRAAPAGPSTEHQHICAWGSTIECHSTRMPESLLAEEIDWLILCEAAHMDRDTWERYLRARLATRLGRVVVPTTPRGRNWVHDLYERGRLGQGGWASFKFATWQNPKILAAEIDDARATLPADTFDEQYGGEFSASAGRVYREFTRELHVSQALPVNAGAVVFKAVDFGYTNPFACLWGALDADGRLLIVRE